MESILRKLRKLILGSARLKKRMVLMWGTPWPNIRWIVKSHLGALYLHDLYVLKALGKCKLLVGGVVDQLPRRKNVLTLSKVK
jgi:hypothetical protein